jgi:hypothetical protein
MKDQQIVGRWRIVEMELWDQDFIDLIEPGYFEFGAEGFGYFGFGAVQGDVDAQLEGDTWHFSWIGDDEGDPRSGRGWMRLADGKLNGRFFFHRGDASDFECVPFEKK